LLRVVEAAGVILLLNLPLGYYRAGVRKFSVPWFVAVHAGVPFVIGVRLLSGVGWRLITFPMFIGAYAAGQLLGGRIQTRRARAVDGNDP
jgi:hypothetical protein